MSKQKQKGTAFETECVNRINSLGGAWSAERLALAGANDNGDIIIRKNDKPYAIVECKCYGTVTEKQLDEFADQATTEAENYRKSNGATVNAFLIVKTTSTGSRSLRIIVGRFRGDRGNLWLMGTSWNDLRACIEANNIVKLVDYV